MTENNQSISTVNSPNGDTKGTLDINAYLDQDEKKRPASLAYGWLG